MKKLLLSLCIAAVILALAIFLLPRISQAPAQGDETVTSFTDCVAAGNAVMESYPRQCRTQDGQTFVEYIGNELEKTDLIRVDSPRPNMIVASPLRISGEARGYWFFEASFPVTLLDANGNIVAEHYASAQGEWMTEEFVPYTSELVFTAPATKTGTLILQKDNPSDLPEHDDQLEIPVRFE